MILRGASMRVRCVAKYYAHFAGQARRVRSTPLACVTRKSESSIIPGQSCWTLCEIAAALPRVTQLTHRAARKTFQPALASSSRSDARNDVTNTFNLENCAPVRQRKRQINHTLKENSTRLQHGAL